MDEELWSECIRFHGHACGGLAIGYRAAMLACEILGIPPEKAKDEEVVCVAENDACGLDSIQVVLSCTVGKGNLVLRPRGKSAYSFFDRRSGRSVRLVGKLPRDGSMSREEAVRFVLEADASDLFDVKEPGFEVPEKARMFNTITCARCGEGVREDMARSVDGEMVCLDCFAPYHRGWMRSLRYAHALGELQTGELAQLLHDDVRVRTVERGDLRVEGLHPVRPAVGALRAELLHRMRMPHDAVVADQVVGVGDDLLLVRGRHVVPRREAQDPDVLVVESSARMLADDVHQLLLQAEVGDHLRSDVRVHRGVVDRAPDVVEQRAGDHQVYVRAFDLRGELRGDRLHRAAVDDDATLAARLQEELDAALGTWNGRQLSSPSRSEPPAAPLRGRRTGPPLR